MNQYTIALLGVLLILAPAATIAANPSQTELDARCEKAREAKLAPERNRLIADCKNQGKDPAYCERFYSDWGSAHSSDRVPRYSDLPECVAAREAKEGHRASTKPTTTRDGTRPTSNRDSDPSKTKYR